MRQLATLANIGLIACLVWGFGQYGMPRGFEMVLVGFMGLAAALNLFVLYSSGERRSGDEEGMLSLAKRAMRRKLQRMAED